ncbi:cyclic nucleotide-binding protein [Salegentibacter salinarum]|uniref:Cyclic nucleotide-binding protein n=1 Tax=Salegentibacter salinarum TaxID=447422 RepID=A0A2N0TZ32_9FLAO|nr:Crp/Fnr family transcriptional regulator [Salegentibacter salinarum]PKD20013.1 cyclic nucleotide-binding protein [Salegentibacter salinarum]SKB97469.1 cAMP-binding domain of CRP or a regulatory subunit of cAMP-dependent protein kinases [Salegentibacter salinarum]
MLAGIIKSIRKFTDLSEQEISEFIEMARIESYKPKSHFIRAGQIPTKFGIVISGLFRYVYISQEGKEFTKVFMPEGSFISSYSAMIAQTASHFFIEAIEESEVLVISYPNWQKLKSQNPQWNLLLLKLLEKGYSVKEKREREFLLLDAESRYRIFLEEYPELEKRVKQHMIASYLGITPIALSRIRKNMGA